MTIKPIKSKSIPSALLCCLAGMLLYFLIAKINVQRDTRARLQSPMKEDDKPTQTKPLSPMETHHGNIVPAPQKNIIEAIEQNNQNMNPPTAWEEYVDNILASPPEQFFSTIKNVRWLNNKEMGNIDFEYLKKNGTQERIYFSKGVQ